MSIIQNANDLHEETLSASDKIAIWLTDHAGTMYFFYFCCVLALIPLLWSQSLSLVQFISSGFLQLVFLPLILLTQNLQNRHAEIRADQDYEINQKAEVEIEDIQDDLDTMLDRIATVEEALLLLLNDAPKKKRMFHKRKK